MKKDYSAFIFELQEHLSYLESKRSLAFKPVVLGIVILLLVLVIPISFASNYKRTLEIKTQYGLVNRDFHFSIPFSLYEYYNGKISEIVDYDDYSTFVTPNVVKPIADDLRNHTLDNSRSDQEFANAVLSLVHQIPYANCEIKYPVETIVDNFGKCDTLSLLAASIMKAGGLDVVLLYFKQAHHINVGVHLSSAPCTTWWWLPPTGYEFNGKTYWVAECTAAMEWKIGDLPPLLEGEQPWIITLENSEAYSPARVSSKLSVPLNASNISINLSTGPYNISRQERELTISGSLSPACPNETIAVYCSQDGISYESFRTETDSSGNYSFSWNLTSTGTCYIRTSWSGNENYTGADSEILTVFLGFPQSLVQFEGPMFYYMYGRGYIAKHELRVRQGVENFLNIQMLGTGILLTGDFIIVNSGKIITVPIGGESDENLENLVFPRGYQPLRLPDDIEETTNNQFGFILQNSGSNNYTLNVRGLDAYEVDDFIPSGESSTAFLNTSGCIKENTWYKVEAKISEDEVTAQLKDANGTIIEGIEVPPCNGKVDELVILLANNTDRAVAFKNLNIQNLNNTAQTFEEAEKTADILEIVAPYATLTILVATVFAVVYMKKRKHT